MAKSGDDEYVTIVKNRKFEVAVLDPKEARRDNVRVTLYEDDGKSAYHHLRAYEVIRLIRALESALEFGPEIPGS